MLAVLAGVPLVAAAAQIGTTVADLTEAVALYQAAGHAALTEATSGDWYQAHVEPADWETAENTIATNLLPVLRDAETDGAISAWWFIRKVPCWRLRFHTDATAPATLEAFVADALDNLTRQELVRHWWPSIYEPETPAFGGPTGIAAAHHLFHHDSRSILEYLGGTAGSAGTATVGRRELSLLLCTTLMRTAGLDWHEQGDVWHRVTLMRPLPPDTTTGQLRTMANQVGRLLSFDTSTRSLTGGGGPLASAKRWLTAFADAGNALGAAAQAGTLRRGLRDVLAHHMVFHWNRLGLRDHTQGVLAHAAAAAILNVTDVPSETGADVAPT